MADDKHRKRQKKVAVAMRAVQLAGPKDSRICELPTPKCRGHEVLVKLRATGVCGTDVELFDGTLGYFKDGLSVYPLVPGHEWAGEIAEVGEDLQRKFFVGQRVVGEVPIGCATATCDYCPEEYNRCPKRTETGVAKRNGGFAEFMVCPGVAIHALPDTVPFDTAVLAEPLSVAVHSVEVSEVRDGEEVVVFGDGPIGLLLLQVLQKHHNCNVIVVGATAHRLLEATRLGASRVFNVLTDPKDSLHEFLKTKGSLPRVVFEASGNPAAVSMCVSSACTGGRVILVGLTGGRTAALDVDQVVLQEITIVGAVSAVRKHWLKVIELLKAGSIETIVSHRLKLTEYEMAIEALRTGKGFDNILKIIVEQ